MAAPGAGEGGLVAWARSQAPVASGLAEARDAGAPRAREALALVRAFLAERELVVYGGQAIDYALRLAGAEGLYPEWQLPDYDAYSPDAVGDAYDLAGRLHAAGFPRVGVLHAIHVTTMRVKTDAVFVADLSYAPPEVFRALPRLDYRGLRVLHPDCQRAAMHLAFCFPYNAPPREDVLSRFGKDLPRLELFDKYYPLSRGPTLAALGGGANARVREAVALGRVALHGFAAYGLLRGALDELRAGLPDPPPLPAGLPGLAVSLEPASGAEGGDAWVSFAPPGGGLVVATPWPDELRAGRAPPLRRSPYLDLRPETWEFPGGLTAHVTSGRLLAVAALAPGGQRATVVAPQCLLLYFLAEALLAEPGAWRDACVGHYRATQEIIRGGAACLGLLAPSPEDGEERHAAFARLVAASPFGLPVRTLGDENRGAALERALARQAQACGDPPPHPPPCQPGTPGALPRGYYPPGRRPPPYDYGACPAFRLGGTPL